MQGSCVDCAAVEKLERQGKCVEHPYTFLEDRIGTWSEAYTTCLTLGERMLSINSDEEFELVNLYLQQLAIYPGSVHVNDPALIS